MFKIDEIQHEYKKILDDKIFSESIKKNLKSNLDNPQDKILKLPKIETKFLNHKNFSDKKNELTDEKKFVPSNFDYSNTLKRFKRKDYDPMT